MNDPMAAVAGASSVAEIPTTKASRYLQQLCKHFAHKRPTTFDTTSGRISLNDGDCILSAEDAALKLSLTARDAARMARLQDVVARHLVRFAFREDVQIDWRAA